MSEKRQVSIVFEKDQFIKILTEDPEALLADIYSKETGWVKHEDIILNRSHIRYAGIVQPAQPKAIRQKPRGL
ncbi:hypothetical protein J2TS6_55010 [Paenibacillus albilobatus]|uniref:Uncharacterized protein n=1 Tax=Paenibacillus albilobatus TaxID=2716884 RepID=A0A920CCB0_9BACL|nr:hypothetical protein [Paenibacillus albilobatus]GIO34360.1 hypothetical protein J2TS6_55010 [Paenibacillus albilobatus]